MPKKIGRSREGVETQALTRRLAEFLTVQALHTQRHYPVESLCCILHIARQSYYKWLKHPQSKHEKENRALAQKISSIYEEHPDKGHRRIRDNLERDEGIRTSNKRVLGIMRKLGLKSIVKNRPCGCTRTACDPQYTAENLLHRDFYAGRPNEKWLTDVTEFKYYDANETVHKLYLSAILDLCDRRVVAYQIGNCNDNQLVFRTFKAALAACPKAHPLFHSDRGFQYTNRTFHKMLTDAGMVQSMSRVGHCIDNGPMEGFWGILKRECYYGRKFTDRTDLFRTVTDYISYYNTRRYQHRLFIQTPMEVYYHFCPAA